MSPSTLGSIVAAKHYKAAGQYKGVLGEIRAFSVRIRRPNQSHGNRQPRSLFLEGKRKNLCVTPKKHDCRYCTALRYIRHTSTVIGGLKYFKSTTTLFNLQMETTSSQRHSVSHHRQTWEQQRPLPPRPSRRRMRSSLHRFGYSDKKKICLTVESESQKGD